MKIRQTTNHILMVRPANFGFNAETAPNNAFQVNDTSISTEEVSRRAIAEFDAFVEKLRNRGIDVIVVEDSPTPLKTDAIFPNNWVTFHQDGYIITYPMFSPMRRLERNEAVLEDLKSRFRTSKRHHLEQYEAEQRFLEGTGSMIFDRINRIVYACLSPRTDMSLLEKLAALLRYRRIAFTATDANGKEIYHTNVMMALGETFAIIALDTIRNVEERDLITRTLQNTGKDIIEISTAQMLSFAGNMLQVRNNRAETFLVMSEQAFHALSKQQVEQIEKHTKIIYSPLYTIETYGGGSARCMMAEVFLPEKRV